MSAAQDFLQRVEQTGMVSEPLLAELRRRVSDTHRNMRPEMLAKILVDREELTAVQARKLVAETTAGAPLRTSTPSPQRPEPEQELTLAPIKDEPAWLADEDADDAEYQLVQEEDEKEEVAELDLMVEEEAPEAILIEEPDVDLLEPEVISPPPPTSTSTPPPQPPPQPPLQKDPALDNLLGDPLLPAEEAQSTRLAPRQRGLAGLFRELFGPRRPRKNRWDSPLILLGGGTLILLLAAGFGFFALFYSENAEEIFNAGKTAYEGQSYALAIQNFQRMVARYPSHEKASLARVRIEISKLRQVTDGTKDWLAALQIATTSLPTVKQEEAFGEVRYELAKLLPDITAGLVEMSIAAETTDEKQRLIDLAAASLELVNNPEYLPTSVRSSQEIRIEEIESSIAVARRDISRDRTLAQTLEQIKAAADEAKITEAYQLRDQLLSQFPILVDNTALRDTLSLVAAKERQAVGVDIVDFSAVTADHEATARVGVVLSDQRGSPIAGVAGRVLCVLVRGAVYGIEATSGKVLWRRFVGYETGIYPQPTAAAVGSDFILVDAGHGEILRVKARTGELVWRLPCPGPIARPRIHNDWALVCCGREAESMLLVINVADGKAMKQCRFPVGCVIAPGLVPARKELIQVGTHSSVYVLDAATLTAKQVISLGHSRQSVAATPVAVGSSLVIAENNGSDASLLHVYSAGQEGSWNQASQPIRLRGQVISDPVVDDRRVLVTTDLGEIRVFESPLDQAGLREVAAVPSSGEYVGTSYAVLDRSDIWIANQTFGRYELQATRGEIVTKWVRERDDRFLNPLQRSDGYLYHSRLRVGMLGATVSATQVNRSSSDGSPVWETDIGVPSRIAVNSKGVVHAVTANGAMFLINKESVSAGVTNQETARIDPRLLPKALSQALAITPDAIVFAAPPPLTHMVLSDQLRGELNLVPLRIGSDTATTELVQFGTGLLAACDTGPIHLLDPATGQRLASPFVPRIEPGTRIDWLPPSPTSSNRFMAAEENGRIYSVEAGEKQMKLLAENRLEAEFTAGLAALGDVVYAVSSYGGVDSIVPINSQDLSAGTPTPIHDGVVWGPQRAGDLMLFADATGSIHAFDGTGNLQWKLSEPVGPLAGAPLAVAEKLIFTSARGMIWVVDRNGAVTAKQTFSEPLGSGPVAFNGRLLVAGWDGTLYVIPVPQ